MMSLLEKCLDGFNVVDLRLISMVVWCFRFFFISQIVDDFVESCKLDPPATIKPVLFM